MELILLLAIFGGLYGFVLYARDVIRAFRRRAAGGPTGLWLPEPKTPPRPDRGDLV